MTELSLLEEAAHRMEFSKQLEAHRLEFSRQWEAARQRGDQKTLDLLKARAPVAARYLDAISTRGLEVVSVAAPGVGSCEKTKDSLENRTSMTSQVETQSEDGLRVLGVELQELLDWSSVGAQSRMVPQDLTELSAITEAIPLQEERRLGEDSDVLQLLEKWDVAQEPVAQGAAFEVSSQTEEQRSVAESEVQLPESCTASFFIGTPDVAVDGNTDSNSDVSARLPEPLLPQEGKHMVASFSINTPPQEVSEPASLADLGAAAVVKLTGVLEAKPAFLETEKLGAVEELGAVAERLARALEEAEEPDAEVEPSFAKEPLCWGSDEEVVQNTPQAADESIEVSHPDAVESMMEEAAEEEPNCLESNLENLRRASLSRSAAQEDVKWSLAEKQNEVAANILKLTERLQASVAKYRSSNEGLSQEFRDAEATCERVVTASRPQAASSSSQAAPRAWSPPAARAEGTVQAAPRAGSPQPARAEATVQAAPRAGSPQAARAEATVQEAAPRAGSPQAARAEATLQEAVKEPLCLESTCDSAAAETFQEAAEEPRCLESSLEALRAEAPRGALQEANWGMAEQQHEVVHNIMKLTERLEATMAKYRTSNEGLREGFRGAEASCGRLSLVRNSQPEPQ